MRARIRTGPLRMTLALLGMSLSTPSFAGAGADAGGEAQVVDRVAASVDGHVITLSSLEFFVRVVLIDSGGRLAVDKPLTLELLKKGLGLLIGERLAYDEAENLKVFEVDDQQVADALSHFEGQLGESPDGGANGPLERLLSQSDFQVSELKSVLRRRLRAHMYLDSQVMLQSRVKEADVDDFMAAHRQELGATPSMEVRDQVRQRMVDERKKALILSFLRRLHARAKVRIVDPEFDGSDAAMATQSGSVDSTLDLEE